MNSLNMVSIGIYEGSLSHVFVFNKFVRNLIPMEICYYLNSIPQVLW